MKKIIKMLSSLSLAALLIFANLVPVSAETDRTLGNGYYPETSEVYINASPAMQEMYDLQNSITDSISKKDGKYVYNYQEIQ